MEKYYNLQKYLKDHNKFYLTLSFEEIGEILGFELPSTAINKRSWWGNEDIETTSHSQCRAWRKAGWKVESVDFNERKVTFSRE
jgi:hypothetical protein